MMNKVLLTLTAFVAAASALAQPAPKPGGVYPSKPVRVIVPFAPGGSNDIMGRLVAQRLGESTGQTFIVDNRPGAGGIIGTEIVAKAQPDGYTLLVMSATLTVNPSLQRKLPYDTLKDLAPITNIAAAPLMLVVHPSVPARSVAELLAYARAQPDKLNFGSGGPGSTPHLAGEMLKSMARVRMTHVPYKGGGPALTDLVGGQIQLMLENIPSTLPHVKVNRLRALAVTGPKRSPLVPEVPTLSEAGVQGYELVGWNGLFAPAGTPRNIVAYLQGETARALSQPEVKERLSALGAEGVGNTPAEFSAFVRAELKKWAQVVRDANIKLD